MVGKLRQLRRHPGGADPPQLGLFSATAPEVALLTLVLGASEQQTLAELVGSGARRAWCLRTDGACRFLHDPQQGGCTPLRTRSARGRRRTARSGRCCSRTPPPSSLDEKIFEIVNQWNRGAALIASRADHEQVAELNLAAGKRAKGIYWPVPRPSGYLSRGLSPARRRTRRWQPALSSELHSGAATGRVQYADRGAGGGRGAAERCCARRAASVVDVAAVTCVRVALYTTVDRSDHAVAACLEYSASVWAPLATAPVLTKEVERELARLWQQLGGRSVQAIAASANGDRSGGVRHRCDVHDRHHLTGPVHRWNLLCPGGRAHGEPQPGARQRRRLGLRLQSCSG